MISSIISSTFFRIRIQPNMSEQEKKRQRIYDLLYTESKPKFLVYHIQSKQLSFFFLFFFFTEKYLFFRKKGKWRIEQKKKKSLFNWSRYTDYERPHNVNKKTG